MTMDVKISIDAMGGDFGPEVTMESLKQVLGSSLDVRASVFGDSAVLRSLICLLYTSPSPRDLSTSRMPSSA